MSLLQALNLPAPPSLASKGAAIAKGAAAGNAAAKIAAAGQPASTAKEGKLNEAAEAWRQTHGQADQRIAALKSAVKSHCADAPPPLLQEIEKGLAKLDAVLGTVDHRLADALASAAKAGDDAARDAELAKARAIVTEYANYVKGDSLVAHI